MSRIKDLKNKPIQQGENCLVVNVDISENITCEACNEKVFESLYVCEDKGCGRIFCKECMFFENELCRCAHKPCNKHNPIGFIKISII